jgi:hypothetical protein
MFGSFKTYAYKPKKSPPSVMNLDTGKNIDTNKVLERSFRNLEAGLIIGGNAGRVPENLFKTLDNSPFIKRQNADESMLNKQLLLLERQHPSSKIMGRHDRTLYDQNQNKNQNQGNVRSDEFPKTPIMQKIALSPESGSRGNTPSIFGGPG